MSIYISEHTKISEIINTDESAIEVIASVNKNFQRLRNPFLRKMLAHRVNIKDAARIGGVKPEVLLRRLKTIGFFIDLEEMQSYEESEIHNTTDNKSKIMRKDKIVKLDVRPILDGGVDPFNAIMDELKKIDEEKETLLIINTFEPIPLLNILKKKGYEYETERPEDGLVHTYLTKIGDGEVENRSAEGEVAEDTFESIEKKYSGKLTEVDVRDLEMPMPMVTILENLEQLKEGEALFVHHKKLPQYLLPELKDRNFVYVSQPMDDDNIKLIIYKK